MEHKNRNAVQEHLQQLLELCGVDLSFDPANGFLNRFRRNFMTDQLDELLLEAIRLRQEQDTVNRQRDRALVLLKHKSDDLAIQLASMQQKAPEELSQEQESPQRPEDRLCQDETGWWVRELIALRDRLQLQQSYCENLPPEQREAAEKVIDQQLKETAKLLKKRDVEILQDCGPLHDDYQTVVMTEPAPSEELEEQIASTVRPGYRMGLQVLRAQEVVLYVKEDGQCL